MRIALYRDETTWSDIVALVPEAHHVTLSAARCLDETVVVADCLCGVHAEPFRTQREVFEFIRSHREAHRV